MGRAEKEAWVARMQADLQKAEAALFLNYTGLKVADAETFRRKVGQASLRYEVVKNTLMKRVLAGTAYEAAGVYLKGTPTGVVWGVDDPVAVARVTFAYMKECQQLQVKGGILDGQVLTPAMAETLSNSPSKGELQAQIAVIAQSPGQRVVLAMKSPSGRILGAIEALAKRLEEAA